MPEPVVTPRIVSTTNQGGGDEGGLDKIPYLTADDHYFEGIEDGVAVVFNKWLEHHVPVDRIDRENRNIIFGNKKLRGVETDENYYLEGGRAMLDHPGEWYLDRRTSKLYYFPLPDESKVVATIPSLINVLRIEGDARNNKLVEHVRFCRLTFSHTNWILPRDSGPTSLGQADIQMEGSVYLTGARNCLFDECEISAHLSHWENRFLIVDGFSNHDWKQTSYIIKTIMYPISRAGFNQS